VTKVRVAAIGDLHVVAGDEEDWEALFERISGEADMLLLAGDLTNFGRTEEASRLADALGACRIPMLAVLGNHDHESGLAEAVTSILAQAGVTLLGEQAAVIEGVGIAGTKGFIGGFGRGELGAFGEDAIKTFVDEAVREARVLENALRSLRTERVIALVHYAPIAQTCEGEPLEIYPFLGSSRLAEAVDRFDNVKAVIHGHAHRGAHRGVTPAGIPVYNCARYVCEAELGRPYAIIEV